jgi:hypothetical protein
MTEIEKLYTRINAINDAINSVKNASTIDRNLSHAKHPSEHFIKALDELVSIRSQLFNLKIRALVIGR